MSTDTAGAPTTAIAEMPPALATKMHDVFRNEHVGEFALGDRTFPIKDLSYDDYIEFFTLAKPILQIFARTMQVDAKDGELDLNFDPMAIDPDALIKVAGADLPKMAWLCCRQSDPKITLKEVKELGRRPWFLAHVVLRQVQHNQLVREFADFFPKLAQDIEALIPEAKEAMMPSTPTRESDTQI